MLVGLQRLAVKVESYVYPISYFNLLTNLVEKKGAILDVYGSISSEHTAVSVERHLATEYFHIGNTKNCEHKKSINTYKKKRPMST